MRGGKTVEARVASTDDPVRLTVEGTPSGWGPVSIEFALILPDGTRIPTLRGRIMQTKSHFVEVVDEAATGPKNGSNPPPTQKVPVEVGTRHGAFYEIRSGISPGTSVLVRPPR